MDYLTNYYKNLCEELNQKVNILQNKIQLINEAVVQPGLQDATGGDVTSGVTPPDDRPQWGPGDPIDPGNTPKDPWNPPEYPIYYTYPDEPNPNDYPGGVNDPNYKRAYAAWVAKCAKIRNINRERERKYNDDYQKYLRRWERGRHRPGAKPSPPARKPPTPPKLPIPDVPTLPGRGGPGVGRVPKK